MWSLFKTDTAHFRARAKAGRAAFPKYPEFIMCLVFMIVVIEQCESERWQGNPLITGLKSPKNKVLKALYKWISLSWDLTSDPVDVDKH